MDPTVLAWVLAQPATSHPSVLAGGLRDQHVREQTGTRPGIGRPTLALLALTISAAA